VKWTDILAEAYHSMKVVNPELADMKMWQYIGRMMSDFASTTHPFEEF